jgi:hypothetical protein
METKGEGSLCIVGSYLEYSPMVPVYEITNNLPVVS